MESRYLENTRHICYRRLKNEDIENENYFINWKFSRWRSERVVCNLANYLADKGHEITILTVSDKQTYKINDNVRHVVLYGESDSKLPHQIINIIRLYRMNRYFPTYSRWIVKHILQKRKNMRKRYDMDSGDIRFNLIYEGKFL